MKAIILTIYLNAAGVNVIVPTIHYVDSMEACKKIQDSMAMHSKVVELAKRTEPTVTTVGIFCKEAGRNDP